MKQKSAICKHFYRLGWAPFRPFSFFKYLMSADKKIEATEVYQGKGEFVRPQLSIGQLFVLSTYWLGFSMIWTGLMSIAMPFEIIEIVGEEKKASTLGMVVAIGAVLSLFVAPVFGSISDRIKLPGGRRLPWILMGSVGTIIGLIGMSFAGVKDQPSSIYLYTAFYVVVIVMSNVASAPYAALIPDMVPHDQRGTASGLMGVMSLLGNLCGGILGFGIESYGVRTTYWAISAVLGLVTGITWFGVKELNLDDFQPGAFDIPEFLKGLKEPFADSDFTWVFITRLLFMLGSSLINQFIQYYFRDVVKVFSFVGNVVADTPEAATSFFIPATLLGALLTTLFAGKLSDKVGRKKVIYASSFILIGAIAVLVFQHSFTAAVIVGFMFGSGWGAFIAVDWALVADVLPSQDDYAKDMGVWHVAETRINLLI
jgi:MFS family permease